MAQNSEIPLEERSKLYRFFEMLPGLLSWGGLVLLVVLAIFNPTLCAIFLLLIFTTTLVKAVGVAYHMIRGSRRLGAAQRIDWRARLDSLEDVTKSRHKIRDYQKSASYFSKRHGEILETMNEAPDSFPKPSSIYNAVILPMYNEAFEILDGTIESIKEGSHDNKQVIITIAYEERGGADAKKTALAIAKKYEDDFFACFAVEHPKDLPNEVIGKGGNITYAGHRLREWLDERSIEYQNVLVTTLDSDNRPHKHYFCYATYEYIAHSERKNLSYQPISLFMNNIWDVPAPMRVVATGNSFWNIISSVRPHTLRNFASHSQPMDALVEMNFWSTRTIVEDGHQYWRSYFHFAGMYNTVPIYVPIYQDAVLSDTYVKTLKAQFIQLRRWAYGASDVAFVGSRIFSRRRNVPLIAGFTRFFRLLDGHVTLAVVPLLVAFGGWVPLLINSEASRSVVANQLPEVLGVMQRFAMLGLIVTVFLAFKMLPPRPAHYRRHRTIGMILQWVLMPVTSIAYSSFSAYYSQTRLLLGRYMTKFDVTDKALAVEVKKRKARKKK